LILNRSTKIIRRENWKLSRIKFFLAIESIVADSLIRAHMNSSIMVEGRTDVKMMDVQPHNLGHQARTG
jgi:hypothetical protein